MSPGRLRAAFFAACVLLATGHGCTHEKCTSTAECGGGEVCAGPSNGPFQCLKPCTTDADCAAGSSCTALTSADCPECDVLTLACVAPTIK
jgi:hypothetical protein